jgi:hypothetical protein
MSSIKQLTRILGRLVLVACLGGVLGFSAPGCSGAGGDAGLSPEAQEKAKVTFKKRFDNPGEKGARKTFK